ncbi:MAG: SDR family NAD(P)-dependent oxidoreductase [Pseudorhizobium pelagicum]|uniref:SDR family NAD(P)-dependent oxidoreductase n=1 Tax=Pseudorhizobium pelagicum TaxID=1509405 RepID=UPI0034605893|tara:strand:- start:255 stop:1007 length:753 start_codon:yes stop_codon:yes gene_type:complete
MERQFAGKVAIVTGAGSGIGEAVAKELAACGARVLVADLYQDAIDRVVGEICANDGKALGFQADVSDPVAVEAMVAYAEETFGGLHLAVNNAGVGGPLEPAADYPLDGWRQVIDINLSGVFYCTKFEIPAMLRAGGGAIVNMASILGSVGTAGAIAYVAAKHGVLGLTKVAAMEYAAQGVRVNAVGPGYIDTPLLANLDPEVYEKLKSLHPIGRIGTSEEVAALTCFLLSDRASFITGSYHLVDGGYVAQ